MANDVKLYRVGLAGGLLLSHNKHMFCVILQVLLGTSSPLLRYMRSSHFPSKEATFAPVTSST